MKQERIPMAIDGWPLIVESIQLVDKDTASPQLEVEWRLDVDHDHFPDISKMSLDQMDKVKKHLDEKLTVQIAKDLADISGGDMIARQIKEQLNGN